MFSNTIDKKKQIVDNNGNTIVDLTETIFGNYVTGSGMNINSVKLNEDYAMRPDKVSFAEYGTIDNTEYILKYSGISNPFSMDRDDVLMIPDEVMANNQMKVMEEENIEVNIESMNNINFF